MRKMNEREMEVLNVLFASGVAMTSSEIVNAGGDITQSTVQTVLRKLLKDRLVEVTGVTYSGNVLSRTYVATDAAKVALLEDFKYRYKRIKGFMSPKELVKYLNQEED